MNTTAYFQTARERYRILLRRRANEKAPWTQDPVFQKYRFCNVHREDDRTTAWFRDEIRSKLKGLKLVESTLIFRWFNRIETGEVIKDLLLGDWDTEEARYRLKDVRPVVTGAFMIKTETGLNKLDGLLYLIDRALPKLPAMVARWGDSIEQATDDLVAIDGMGRFLAYEVTTDLRWTPVLSDARDIMTWANPGPGCSHGLSRLFDPTHPWKWNRNVKEHRDEMIAVMRQIVEQSQNPDIWPSNWPAWEMRTAEHWACEYDKWYRGTTGAKLKRRYRA